MNQASERTKPTSMLTTVRDCILDHYQRQPDRLYVRCVLPNGEDAPVTYGRLVERGACFAAALRDAGAAKGDIVVVILPHSADLYCAFFGAILGGQVPSMLAVPSLKLNPEHYRAELEALLRRTQAAAVITDTETAEHLDMSGHTGEASARLILADDVLTGAPLPDSVAVSPDDLVLLQHSSGSTGLKKGVALSNRAVLHQVRSYAAALELQETDRIASWLPLYHDMGLIACAVAPVITAVPVTALSPFHWITRPASLLRAIHEDRCTLAWMPNFAYEFLAARVRESQLEGVRLDSMRGWINCSEPTIAESHRRFHARFEPYGVREETLLTCYAMAETTFAATQTTARQPARIERVNRDLFLGRRRAAPCESAETPAVEVLSAGPLLPDVEARIVDDAGVPLGERQVGEITLRCGSLFSGYFREPEATAATLRDGWHHSGDLGYLADGHLFVTGRKKDVIIVAGKNLYPQDIERVVSAVPGVYPGRCVALGLDDASIGTQRLIVLAEVEDDRLINSPELQAAVRAAVGERMDCAIDDLRLLPHMWLLKTSSGKIA
ncbi:MAG: AMP-binding protein, partial [Actinomycetota bacterium]